MPYQRRVATFQINSELFLPLQAINYAASDPNAIKSVMLLSPGLNYRGVSTSDAITKYKKTPIHITAAEGDSGSAKDSQTLYDKIDCGENLKI
jgi:hypothetical protein